MIGRDERHFGGRMVVVVMLIVSTLLPVSLVLLATGGSWKALVPFQVYVLTRRASAGTDSWSCMAAAYQAARRNPGGDLYREVFFRDKLKFQYPPTALLYNWIVDRAGQTARYDDINTVLSWMALLTVWLTPGLLLMKVFAGAGKLSAANRLGCLVIGSAIFVVFHPNIRAHQLGQTQIHLNALFGIALLLWVVGGRTATGVVLGIMTLVKPQYALILAWGILRRQWGMVRGFLAASAAGVAAALMLFGLASVAGYSNVLSYLGRRGESYFPNQSVNGIVQRLSGANVFVFDPHEFPNPAPWIAYLTLASSVVIIGAIAWRCVRMSSPPAVEELALVALGSTMASPIAWEHHYGIMAGIFGILIGRLMVKTHPSVVKVVGLWASLALSGGFIEPNPAWGAPPWNLLYAHLFVGALLVMILLSTELGAGAGGQTPRVGEGEVVLHFNESDSLRPS